MVRFSRRKRIWVTEYSVFFGFSNYDQKLYRMTNSFLFFNFRKIKKHCDDSASVTYLARTHCYTRHTDHVAPDPRWMPTGLHDLESINCVWSVRGTMSCDRTTRAPWVRRKSSCLIIGRSEEDDVMCYVARDSSRVALSEGISSQYIDWIHPTILADNPFNHSRIIDHRNSGTFQRCLYEIVFFILFKIDENFSIYYDILTALSVVIVLRATRHHTNNHIWKLNNTLNVTIGKGHHWVIRRTS